MNEQNISKACEILISESEHLYLVDGIDILCCFVYGQ